MPLFDHLAISVHDLTRSIAQFDPVMRALGCTRQDADGSVSWYKGEEELILFPAREVGSGPHETGRVGWQHLAFAVGSREEVDRLHAIAMEAGWTAVRGPKLYPRFNERYYASFIEDDNGIRLEFMFNPPRISVEQG
jgi:catechol 2,3-dioxygenase-like lactoylglutathione lyase family enzyme